MIELEWWQFGLWMVCAVAAVHFIQGFIRGFREGFRDNFKPKSTIGRALEDHENLKRPNPRLAELIKKYGVDK